jgi:hypothetical protein
MATVKNKGERVPISTDQQSYVEHLRVEWKERADHVREFDRLTDMVKNSGSLFSNDAHAYALGELGAMLDRAKEKEAEAKKRLKENEGWQSRR